MDSRYWHDTIDYPDRKRKRQAEFLAFEFFPLDAVLEIGVFDTSYQHQVYDILETTGNQTPVNV